MRNEIVRYLCFITGLFFLSLGVDFIVASSLGTTPISSINYVLSLNLPITLGVATFVFNMVVIAMQFWLVRGIGSRRDYVEIMLQIPFSLLFSIFIDFNMLWISRISISGYAMSLLLLVTGCIAQAIGVVLELKPNVAIMSAEGFVKYFCRRYNRDFGKTKVVFDISLVITAILLSLVMAGRIDGVREGTLIAALSTGFLVNLLARRVMTRRMLHRVHTIYTYPLTMLKTHK
ncbi:MAG: hypothetical protein K2M76_05285 [Muribaculaceae bacterium]|nr:hypothetical protein [Muribaculaceae bacterium]